MSKIVIKRNSSFYGSARNLKVLIDEQEVGTIKNKSSEGFEVIPGEHKVQAGFGKFSGMSNSLMIECKENDVIYLEFEIPKIWMVLYFTFVFAVVIICLQTLDYTILLGLLLVSIILSIVQAKYMYKLKIVKEEF